MAPYVDLANVVDVGDDPVDARLAQEFQDAEYAKRLQDKEQRSTPYARNQSDFMDERTASMSSDEETARRIQQELQDADYAQRLSVMERNEAAAQAAQEQENVHAARTMQQPRRRCMTRIIPLLICGTAIAVIPLLFVFGVFDKDDIPFWDDLFGDDWIGGPTSSIL